MASQTAELCSSSTLVAISTPSEPETTLDIIAVHGMNVQGNDTHAENTWTHDGTGVNWLKSLLPERLPMARILAFQYNAAVVFGASEAGVKEQATNLLGCLKQKRKLNPARPMIFITHSLGGIIVKEALATAFREYEAYPMIWTFTYAIFFLAVPHKGSKYAKIGKYLAHCYLEVTNQPRNSLLDSVSQTSVCNEELNGRFKPLHEAYMFYSWIESLPLSPFGMIVPNDSATLGLPATQEKCRHANRDHRTICKFSGADDPEWIELSAAITEAAQAATNSLHYSPIMDRRRDMFTALALQDGEERVVSVSEASNKAQSVISRVDDFRNGKELQRKQEDSEDAKGSIWMLATLLLTVLAPILNLLNSFALSWPLQSIAWAGALALLPSKEQALERAREGQEAEKKVMEVEAWAIERLSDHLRGSLRASHMLQRAISHQQLEDQDEVGAQTLSDARSAQRSLLEPLEFITKELHERQQSYSKAEAIWNKIERVREEAAGQDKKEFWIATATMVQREKDAQEQAPENHNGTCPCVIL